MEVSLAVKYKTFSRSAIIFSQLRNLSAIIIQLCFVEYKYRAKRVQISHDICTRLIPPGRVKFKTLASQDFGKRNRWIINLLLDVLVCSIAVYFYSLFVF